MLLILFNFPISVFLNFIDNELDTTTFFAIKKFSFLSFLDRLDEVKKESPTYKKNVKN